MVCTSKVQADKVALAGAAKMAGEGYSAVQSPMNPDVFKVYKADGKWYRVEIGKMPRNCPCEFFKANRQFKTCKHCVFCEAEAEAIAYWAKLAAGADTKPSIYSAFDKNPKGESAFAVR